MTTPVGYDIAALTLNLPYQLFHPREPVPTPAELDTCTGTFQFGPDFYQPNAKLVLSTNGRELSLHWPSGSASSLIPLDRDRFIDRSYWEPVNIERDGSGHPVALVYDHFKGPLSGPE